MRGELKVGLDDRGHKITLGETRKRLVREWHDFGTADRAWVHMEPASGRGRQVNLLQQFLFFFFFLLLAVNS